MRKHRKIPGIKQQLHYNQVTWMIMALGSSVLSASFKQSVGLPPQLLLEGVQVRSDREVDRFKAFLGKGQVVRYDVCLMYC